VQYLLSGGQACILYGASEFSRDADTVIGGSAGNIEALRAALRDLDAEQLYVPPLNVDYLNRGHACHFRCRAPAVAGVRLDVMSVLRGCDPFPLLWVRRTTLSLPELGEVPLLSLPDLVQSKKTQRDKDWSHIRRLVEVDYLTRKSEARDEDMLWWLAELRTPAYLVELAAARPDLLPRVASRPWLACLGQLGEGATEAELLAEQQRARAEDRAYWGPLREELEHLRRQRRAGG